MIYKLKGTLTSAFFIIIVLLVLSVLVLTPFISMILLGAIFAYVIRPISRRLEPNLKFRSLTIVVAMIMVIIPLIILLIIVFNGLIESVPSIIYFVKSLDLTNLNSTNAQNSTLIQNYVPSSLYPYIGSSLNAINLEVTEILRSILGYFLDILESIPMLLLQLFIFFASTFYFARDGDKLWQYVDHIIPHDRKDYFDRLFEETDRVLKSIFFGHFLTAIITGTLAAIGFFLLGYPFALFLGIITGFFQLIPVIGHWPIPVMLSFLDLLAGNYLRAVLVLVLSVLLSVMDVFLRPHLSGRYADVHPLIFMLGFLSGPLVFGLVGFIIGPLILGVTYAAVVAYKQDSDKW
jgi:predicted PurR-regulated permease PerM